MHYCLSTSRTDGNLVFESMANIDRLVNTSINHGVYLTKMSNPEKDISIVYPVSIIMTNVLTYLS